MTTKKLRLHLYIIIEYIVLYKWFGTSKNLFHKATHYATKTKNPFDFSNFWWDFYEVQKKATGYIMRTLREWQKLVLKDDGHLFYAKPPVAL